MKHLLIYILILCLGAAMINPMHVSAQVDPNSIHLNADQIKELEKKANKGDYMTILTVGVGYCMGFYGMPVDMKRGMEFLKKGCEIGEKTGDATGMALYSAMLLEHPECSNKADEEVLFWATRGKLLNNMTCVSVLGQYFLKKGKIYDALTNLNQAALSGDVLSISKLSYLYLGNEGVDSNYEMAFKWASEGAALNNPDCLLNLANIYYYGLGRERDIDKSIVYAEKAMDNGADCAYLFIDACMNSTNPDYNIKGFELLKNRKGDDNPAIWYSLGMCYEKGIGTPVDEDKAMQWYGLASMAGHQDASAIVAEARLYGKMGMEKDEDAALEKLMELEENSNFLSCGILMNWCWRNSKGSDVIKHLMIMLDKCDTDWKNQCDKATVLFNIGIAYSVQEMGIMDMDESLKWFNMIKESDNPSIYHSVQGMIHYDKDFGIRDYEVALKHYRKLIEISDDPVALYSAYRCLSAAYRYGRGVEPDEELADRYLKKAESYDGSLVIGKDRTSDMMRRVLSED